MSHPFGFAPFAAISPPIQQYWGDMYRISAMGPTSSIYRVEFKCKIPHHRHCHPEDAETIFVAKGGIEQDIEGEKHELFMGDFAVIPTGAWHSAKPQTDDTVVIVQLAGKSTEYGSVEAPDGRTLEQLHLDYEFWQANGKWPECYNKTQPLMS